MAQENDFSLVRSADQQVTALREAQESGVGQVPGIKSYRESRWHLQTLFQVRRRWGVDTAPCQ